MEINGESSEGLHEEMKEESNEKRLQLHVNSVILASHSEYFMSLFGNGMSESSSEVVVVQVTEEGVLSFIAEEFVCLLIMVPFVFYGDVYP